MGKYFGTDGFRGEANVKLTAEHAYKVGRYIGWYFGRDHKAKIIIGKDTRRSSYMFEYSLVSGLTASGADVYLLHVTTTPSISYVVRNEEFDCGIMISASHNPFNDNGIKLINGEGYKMEAEIEEKVENYIDGIIPEIPFATGEAIGRTVDYVIGRQRYIDYLVAIGMNTFGEQNSTKPSVHKLSDLRIGLDLANGSATQVARSVYWTLGAKIFVINSEPNGININTNCGSTHIEGLQRFVVENGLDVGFAYDGDADRCLAVDEKGNVIDGDLIMYVCGKYMHEHGELNNDTVVTTIMSNLGLYKALDKLGLKYEKTKVGDKYVSENMMENDHSLGGENSGHIIFRNHAVTGDGVLTSLKVLGAMLGTGRKLSELAGEMKVYPQVLKNVRVKDKAAAREDADVMAAVEEVAGRLSDNGRILVRESGTEPVIRVMVEAGDLDTCDKEVDYVIDMLRKKGHSVQ